MGLHSCSTNWGTSGAHRGTWSLDTEVCVELTPGCPTSGVSRCRSARPRYRYLHNSCCISGGRVFALICCGAQTCVSVVYPHSQFSVSYVRARSPVHEFGRYAAGARGTTLYSRGTSVMWMFGRCGTSPVSSATCIRLTSFPMCSPMSIDAGCGGSHVGPHSCSTTALLARTKGPGRRYTGVCVELTAGSPLSCGAFRCRSAHPATVICITVVVLGGYFCCTNNLPLGTNLRKCFLPPRPVG